MSMVYVLVPLALAMSVAAVAVFVWAARSGQFDDCETPAHRAIVDDPEPPKRTARPTTAPPSDS